MSTNDKAGVRYRVKRTNMVGDDVLVVLEDARGRVLDLRFANGGDAQQGPWQTALFSTLSAAASCVIAESAPRPWPDDDPAPDGVNPAIASILADPSASYWLKAALTGLASAVDDQCRDQRLRIALHRGLLARDPVDALHDVERLADALRIRAVSVGAIAAGGEPDGVQPERAAYDYDTGFAGVVSLFDNAEQWAESAEYARFMGSVIRAAAQRLQTCVETERERAEAEARQAIGADVRNAINAALKR